jgi:hypothetical protein
MTWCNLEGEGVGRNVGVAQQRVRAAINVKLEKKLDVEGKVIGAGRHE